MKHSAYGGIFKKSILSKILLFLVVFPSLLFASVSEQEFQEAYAYYKKGDFQSANDAFKKLFFVAMDNERVNFYLGRSALEIGEFDTAIAAFERVLILKPDHARSRLELGRAYYGKKMYDQAEAEFNKVLSGPVPPEVREAVERYLALIIQVKKKNYLSGMAAIGFQNDSNVNNGNDYTIRALGDVVVNPAESDTSHTEMVTLRHIYDFFDKGGFFWQTDALVYAQSYSEYDDFNLLYSTLSTGPGLKYDSFAVNLVGGLDHLTLGGEDFIDVTHVSLKMQFPSGDQLLSIGVKKLDRKNLIKENEGKDTEGYELNVDMRQAFTSTSSVFNIGFIALTERKKSGERLDVDFDEAGMKVGFFQQFGKSFFANVTAAVKGRAYVDEFVDINTGKGVERTDTNQNVTASLSYKFLESYTATLNATQMSNSSTYDPYTYSKNTVGLTVSMQF